MADPPEVTILLLGDAQVGKTTFLSYVAPLFLLHGFLSSPTTPPRNSSPLMSAPCLNLTDPDG
jgi:hypothetical protein